MKALIVISTVILSAFLAITTIFTIDSVTVRKAEMASIVAVNYSDVVEEFFEGRLSTIGLREKLINEFQNASHTKTTNVDVTVKKADATKGILNILVEVTYDQPNGRPRLISCERVYILERNELAASNEEGEGDGEGETEEAEEYSFIRTIRAETYKTSYGVFVEEANGGLKENSIWRTPDFEIALDAVFANH